MGRMKELFIQIKEQEEAQEIIEQASVFDSGILCPNCQKTNLIEYSAEDLYCEVCGYDFIRIEGNHIRFK